MTEENYRKARDLYSEIASLNTYKQRLINGAISAVVITDKEDKCRRKIEFELPISDDIAFQIKDKAIKECEVKLIALQEQFYKL